MEKQEDQQPKSQQPYPTSDCVGNDLPPATAKPEDSHAQFLGYDDEGMARYFMPGGL